MPERDRTEYQRQWKLDNPEKRKATVKRSYEKNKEKYRATYVAKTYGITVSEFNFLKLIQQGKCAICSNPSSRGDLDVDHCHETNKVRGLLCNNCNRGLGHFKDSPELLTNAIEYLKQ